MPHFEPCKKCGYVSCVCPVIKGGKKVQEKYPYPTDESVGEIRAFQTGATRDQDKNKLDYEGFLSPLVLQRFAQYMHKYRVQSDGELRESDNWQRGIPKEVYMKSLLRHVMELWLVHREPGAWMVTMGEVIECKEIDIQDTLCAILFNTQGFLFELLRPVVEIKVETRPIGTEFWHCHDCGRDNDISSHICTKCLTKRPANCKIFQNIPK